MNEAERGAHSEAKEREPFGKASECGCAIRSEPAIRCSSCLAWLIYYSIDSKEGEYI
jgi:hypothetical protein